MKTSRTWRYTELDVNDSVHVYKKNDDICKERISVWSDKTYAIERIAVSHDQEIYKLDGLTKEYMRHELLKVLV